MCVCVMCLSSIYLSINLSIYLSSSSPPSPTIIIYHSGGYVCSESCLECNLPNISNNYLWFYRKHPLGRWMDTNGGKEMRHLFVFYYTTDKCL